jgi:hypothetical protein
MSKARDALYDLKNGTEIGYTWEDLEFYITGKLQTKTPDLRLAIQETLDLLKDAFKERMYEAKKPEQLKLKLRYKK